MTTNLKFKIVTLCLLLASSLATNIIPGQNFPVMMNKPSSLENGSILTFRFSLNGGTANQIGPVKNKSNGLTYKQFIGVEFPSDLSTFDLTSGASAPFTCALSDGTNSISVTAVKSVVSPINSSLTAEKTVAYCRIDDMTANVPLKTDGTLYTLTLTLSSVKFSTTHVDNVCLFTSTANHKEKMIIDSLPVVGSLGVYGDYKTYSTKDLEASSMKVSIKTGAAGTDDKIFPNNSFDLSMKISVKNFINMKDHFIVFEYPSNAVTPPTAASSTKGTDGSLQNPLQGSLSVGTFGTGALSLDGISEDLLPNREFQLNLTGWKALETSVNEDNKFRVIVYYKNTYSIVSYQELQNTLKVTPATITLAANHPEHWDVYSRSAWPILFTFSSNSDLPNGGWVKIQHTNAMVETTTNGNIVNFIASTCDFSDNSFDQTFQKRQNCYPLQNNLEYTTSNDVAYNGSGFMFKMPTMTKSTNYYVSIWGYFDVCGKSAAVEKENLSTIAVQPKFSFEMFTSIDVTKTGSDRLKEVTNGSQIVAKASAQTFAGKCWRNSIFGGTIDDKAGIELSQQSVMNAANTTGANVKSFDITTWDTFNFTDETVSPKDAFFKTTATFFKASDKPDTEVKYLYSSTQSNKISNSYFFVFYSLYFESNTTKKTYDTNLIPYTDNSGAKAIPGRIIYQFPNKWFTTGDAYSGTSAKCWCSWNVGLLNTASSTASAFTNDSMIPPSSSGVITTSGTDLNFFGAKTDESGNSNQVDTNLSQINPSGTGTASIFRIVSDFTNEAAKFNIKLNKALGSDLKVGGGAFASTCAKWKDTRPTITSLYTYIDIQVQNTFAADANAGIGVTVAIYRFIKLFPELGVVNDKAKIHGYTSAKESYTSNHVAYVVDAVSAVCLLELNGSEIKTQKPSGGSTLAIWMFGVALIESDYNTLGATYPAAPLSSAKAYGLSSAPMIKNTSALGALVGGDIYSPIIKRYSMMNQFATRQNADFKYQFNAATSYEFFMGSLVLFTGVGSDLTESTETSLFVPYYCPAFMFDSSSSNFLTALNIFPVVIGAWLDMTSYKNINSMEIMLKSYTHSGTISVITQLSNATVTGGANVSASGLTSANIIGISLRWDAYNETADPQLKIYNGTLAAAGGTDLKCTGYTLFLTSTASFATGKTVEYTSGSIKKQYDGTSTFYVFGKPFAKSVYVGIGFGSAAGDTVEPTKAKADGSASTASYYTNITRPTIESFLSSGKMTLADHLAFFCSSANKGNNNYGTNYVDSTVGFTLNLSAITTGTPSNFKSPSLTTDLSAKYQEDAAGNLKAIVQPPYSVPLGTHIEITSATNINSNTVCGIMSGSTSTIIGDCVNSSSTIQCPTPAAGNVSFTICCYNIKLKPTVKLDKVEAKLQFNNYSATYYTQIFYTAAVEIAGTNPFQFTNSYSTDATDLTGTNGKNAVLKEISYEHTKQEDGYGKARFLIELKRQLVRGMKLEVKGDLSKMKISSVNPRCVVTTNSNDKFGNSWDSGDVLIDTCSVSQFTSSTPITVTTKSIIYKCGLSFSDTLYVSLWPVKIVNWAADSAAKSFKTNLTVGSENITKPDVGVDLQMKNSVSAKVGVSEILDSLCKISKIEPNLPGIKSDYTFEFNLENTSASLKDQTANEYTIFLPYMNYGAYINNILCMDTATNTLLNCSFSDEGILNIRTNDATKGFGTGSKMTVTLLGVPNPYVTGDLIFPCTVNKTNFDTGVRQNLLVGSGKYTTGINTTSVTQTGVLKILNIATPLSVGNTRVKSTHTFRMGFDRSIAITATGKISFTSTPCIYFLLPDNYSLAYNTLSPSTEIDEYENVEGVIKKTKSVTVKSTKITGNRITVEIDATTYDFNDKFMYWDVKISDIENPIEPTPSNGSTGMYSIILANMDNTIMYKTHTNLNNFVGPALATKINYNLKFNRGNVFTDNTNKWIVDIFSDETQLNKITVKPGRYIKSYMKVRDNTSKLIKPSVTLVSLDSTTVFKTAAANYSVSTSYMEKIPFWFGCTCTTVLGRYVIRFTSSDSTNFALLAPIEITVDNSTKATISYANPKNIVIGGSTIIPYLLTEPNFDELSVEWKDAPNVTNDASSKFQEAITKIASATITPTTTTSGNLSPVYSTFLSTNSKLPSGTTQKYTVVDPNACFQWANKDLTITMSESSAIIPENFPLEKYFTYENASKDSTLKMNSLKFTFTPPAAHLYLYCALGCISSTLPNDEDIQTNAKNFSSNSTPLLQYYYNVFYSTDTSKPIVFDNLVRGQAYKLRCFIESTEGDLTLRTRSNGTLENYEATTENEKPTPIVTVDPMPTSCARWNFNNEPGADTKTAIVNYCQKVFSKPGWFSNGCVICVDSDLKGNAPGLEFTKNTTCAATTSARRRLRFLADTDTKKDESIVNTPAFHTVCAVQNKMCEKDSIASKSYADFFVEFTNDLKTGELFEKNAEIKNVNLNTTNAISTFTDAANPDISNLVVTVDSAPTADGSFSFSVTNSVPLRCYMKIATSQPTAAELKTCADRSRCDTVSIGPVMTNFKSASDSLKAFDPATYNVYSVCQNDVPGAVKMTEVKNVGTFTIAAPEESNSGSESGSENPSTVSAGFIGYSVMALMTIMMMLF